MLLGSRCLPAFAANVCVWGFKALVPDTSDRLLMANIALHVVMDRQGILTHPGLSCAAGTWQQHQQGKS
jgi:hypothetical protein